jgi:hypothetical protein
MVSKFAREISVGRRSQIARSAYVFRRRSAFARAAGRARSLDGLPKHMFWASLAPPRVMIVGKRLCRASGFFGGSQERRAE